MLGWCPNDFCNHSSQLIFLRPWKLCDFFIVVPILKRGEGDSGSLFGGVDIFVNVDPNKVQQRRVGGSGEFVKHRGDFLAVR